MSVCTSLNPKPFFKSSNFVSHHISFIISPSFHKPKLISKPFSVSAKFDPNPNLNPNPKSKAKAKRAPSKSEIPQNQDGNKDEIFPKTIPRKPRRGRRSEAVAVEDFVREKLEETFESIRQQSSEVLEDKEKVLKDKDDIDEKENDGVRKKKVVVEEDDPNWPLDADIGWGIRASEYFDKHSIKNVVGDDGVEIDWEGEVDDNYVKEINCLEWESFAFHPSPLIVLVFERYNRANDNWKFLKELEKAIQVYWNAKDRLPPRTVKIDINIERDLAYALKVRECPQLLFLRGNKILYCEKEIRSKDELVQMIAHFYYNAKKPSWIDDAALAPP
ncbi:Thioredoxin-like fold domain-containing protein mrl7 protein [Thalictrum thalictroides]|uniref:Thioredoxin-like fold domain-containing protein mrl7 protein n=1 Tax=Thalictrum thalictroides TaxID=46969 RepID=A0A7J6WZK3_THATH|nr:Thioredoxin-like fold domain-containing protein mrl7 protein [Thalictrum thalictroides]